MAVTLDTYRFGFWTIVLLTAAVAVILYQHAVHTGQIIGLLGSANPAPQPIAGAISSQPDMYGASSRASGQWTPLGPAQGVSVFPYQPAQRHQ